MHVQVFEEELVKIPQPIHIIKEGCIHEWNLASDIVVSSFSTSLLEAAVANKPAYFLQPYPMPSWLEADWHSLIPRIKSLEQFENICRQDLDVSSSQPLQDYLMQTCLSRGNPVVNIAKILHDLRKNRTEPAIYVGWHPKNVREFLWQIKKKTLRKLRSLLNYGPSATPESKPLDAKVQYANELFTERDVHQRIKRWKKILTNHRAL
jgi:hypothetical protein